MSEETHKKRRAVASVLPLEWRERVRIFADANGTARPTDDVGARILALRDRLKSSSMCRQPRRVKNVQVPVRAISR